MINVRINGYPIRSLIDTGAKRSCIDLNLLRKLHILWNRSDALGCLYGADSKQIPILGSTIMEISVGDLRIPAQFYVLSNLTHHLILGIDFLTESNAVIDISRGVVTFQDNLVVAALINKKSQPLAFVRNLKSVFIPPCSEAVIMTTIDRHYALQTSIVEPCDHLCFKKLALARAIVTPHTNQIACRLLNPTSTGVLIKKGYRLGKIEPVVLSDINSIGNQPKPHEANDITQIHTQILGGPKTADDILSELGIELDPTQLNPEEHLLLKNFLVQNKDVFATSLADLAGTNLVSHVIDTGDASPIRQRAYRTAPAARDEISKQTAEMLKLGIIQPSESPWVSTVLLDSKKDGTQRFCVDFRKLNKVTKPQYFPLPTMQSVIDCMAEKQPQIYSLIDAKSGYWQCPLDENTPQKTGFATSEGQFQFSRLPFGLINAPYVFQTLMHKVLRGLLYKYSLVYIDDVLVFSQNLKEHIEHLDEVFKRFRQANLRLHPKKCVFGVRKIKYLGYIMSGQGIEMDQSKVKAMRDFPTPISAKTLRSFLGFCGFYRRFIKGYAEVVHPMHWLLKMDATFVWSDECEKAFVKLKDAMSTAPILRYPDFNKEFTLITDASYQSIAYILAQEDEGKLLHPVGYGGRSLRPNELNYTVTEIELLSLLEACRHFHPYLANRPFKVLCDHVSLKYLSTLKVATGRLARWAMYLMAYDMTIIHVAGKANVIADAFSRRPYAPEADTSDAEVEFEQLLMNIEADECDQDLGYRQRGKASLLIEFEYPKWESREVEQGKLVNTMDEEEEDPQVIETDFSDIAPVQRACPDFRQIMNYLEKGVLPFEAAEARNIILRSENYVIVNGRLFHIWEPSAVKGLRALKPIIQQLCVPRSLRGEIVEAYHHQNSHVGFERTYATVRGTYYWPNMYKDLHDVIMSCQECQRSKKSPGMKNAPLTPVPCESLFDRVHVDLVGPLPTSPDGYKYILTIVESFSRYPIFVPLKSQRADELSEAIFANVFCNWGAVLSIVSDLGKNLTSKVMKCLCDIFIFKHLRTSSYHPQANATSENMNRNIWNKLRVYCEDQHQWPKYLPAMMYSYRATKSIKTTGLSPFECMYPGRKMRLPIDAQFETPRGLPMDAELFIKGLTPRVKMIDDLVKKNTSESQKKSKEYYDRNSAEPQFEVGDKCWE